MYIYEYRHKRIYIYNAYIYIHIYHICIYIHIYHICHVIYILPTKLMLLEERDKHISGAQLILLNEKIDKKKNTSFGKYWTNSSSLPFCWNAPTAPFSLLHSLAQITISKPSVILPVQSKLPLTQMIIALLAAPSLTH